MVPLLTFPVQYHICFACFAQLSRISSEPGFCTAHFFSLIYYTVQVWASHESSDSEPDDRLQAAQWETIFGHGVPWP